MKGEIGIFLLFIIIFFLIRQNMKLRRKNKNLDYIINSMDEVICFKDKNHRIINANSSFLGIFDLDKKAIGKTDDELIKIKPERKAEFECCKKGDQIVKNEGRAIRLEETFLIGEGIYQTFDVAKTPIYDKNNKYLGIVIVGNDITDKLNAEKFKKIAEERDRMLLELRHYEEVRTDFFANLSHEFRTPLNLILSALKMQEVYANDITKYNIEKQKEYTKIIKQNTLRITRLINNIIDITKLEAGHLECYLENYNIVEFIENISMSVLTIVESKKLELIFDTNIEECIMAFDLDKIERVILNLLSNAIKFTEEGGKILITLKDRDDFFDIYIEDSGTGIPLEKQKYIFERFVQVNKSTIRNREGSGIGLNLVQAFIKLHNGNIVIINDTNKGTKFRIRLPKMIVNSEKEQNTIKQNSNIEAINIEFSDIYDINY